MKSIPTLILGLYLAGCSTGPVIDGSSAVPVEPINPVAVAAENPEERTYLQNLTLADLLDENSEVRRAEHALILVWADWCEPCHELMPYLENMAQHAGTNGLSSEQLYLGLVQDFNGDLGGVLDDWVEALPTILYFQSENGNPTREVARMEQGGLAAKLWIAGIVNGILEQYQQ